MHPSYFFSISKVVMIILQVIILGVGLLGSGMILLSSKEHRFYIGGPTITPHEQNFKAQSVEVVPLNNLFPQPELHVRQVSLQVKIGDHLGYRSLLALYFIALCMLTVIGLEQVKGLLQSVKKGSSFSRYNARRVYILAALLYLVPFVQFLSSWVLKQWLLTNFHFSGVSLLSTYPNSIGWIVAATLMVTIGKVFDQGIAIREEQDLTI